MKYKPSKRLIDKVKWIKFLSTFKYYFDPLRGRLMTGVIDHKKHRRPQR